MGGEALMAEYSAQIGESLRTHEDACHDLMAAEADIQLKRGDV